MTRLDIVSPLPPYPPHAGGTAHIFHASRQLSRYFDISLYTLAQDPGAVTWGPMVEWCRDLQALPRVATSRTWRLKAPHVADPPAVYQDWSSALASFLRQHWSINRPQFVQLEFTTMAQYAFLAREAGAVTICTAHNIAFLAQMRRAVREPNLQIRVRRWLGALSLWQYEVRALGQCDVVVVHGRSDGDALRYWLRHTPVVYVPSGIDLEEWAPFESWENDNQVLFVGNYAHPPNLEGALWLVQKVWPYVRQRFPDAHLTLGGRTPPKQLRELATSDISVPGTVDDLRTLYRQTSVVVAPIFWGSGVRVKLLEALACALPIVTTPLAAEGINLVDGKNALFATSPVDFANAICTLLGQLQLRKTLGQAGRDIVQQSYDWPPIARRLAGLYYGVRH